jgi:two-component system sensor histidine kinase KdpD
MAAAASDFSEPSRRINWPLAGIVGLLALTALAIVPLTLTVIQSRTSDALVIDLAGRQRMLLERHMKEILLAAQGLEAEYHHTRSLLQARAVMLIEGGATDDRADQGRIVSVPAALTDEIKLKLTEQQRLMEALFAKSDTWLNSGGIQGPSVAIRDELLADNAALLTLANEIVALFRKQSAANVRSLVKWELLVVLLIMTAGTLGIWRFLRAEQALKRSQALTFQALQQRDAIKSSLLSSISHEIRTPLTAIKTMVFSLQQENPSLPFDIQKEFLSAIDRELNYLNSVVGNLLDMSRLEAGTLVPRREWHVFDELVEGAIRRVEPSLAGHPLEVRHAKDLPPVSADGVQLQQVLVNLLDNAAKFSPPGSPIRLVASLVGDELEVLITNEGEGIPEAELELVFDRFYRVPWVRSLSVPGTGLGLAICKGIIEAHGGSIVARSIPGAETTILFRIPACDPLPTPSPPATAPASLVRGS